MSGFHLFIISRSVRPSRLLRDEEDGRGDKEPVPPPSRLPFVALSPSLLVTHDYALSTADQVLLFASNSMTIIVNLCWAPNVVHTVCPLTTCFTYGYHTQMLPWLHSPCPVCTYEKTLYSAYIHTPLKKIVPCKCPLSQNIVTYIQRVNNWLCALVKSDVFHR